MKRSFCSRYLNLVIYTLLVLSVSYSQSKRVEYHCSNTDTIQKFIDGYSGLMTCEGRCGQILTISSSPAHNVSLAARPNNVYLGYDTTSCSCDWLCYLYNDCCHNFLEKCPKEGDRYIKEKSKRPMLSMMTKKAVSNTCREFCSPSADMRKCKSFQVINWCATKNQPCSELDPYDPQRFIPVYDRQIGLHYTHLECARCNSAKDVMPWKYDIKCNNSLNMLQLDTLRTAVMIKQFLTDNRCQIYLKPEIGLKTLRECWQNVTTTCPDTCQHKGLVDKCELGSVCYASVDTPDQPTEDSSIDTFGTAPGNALFSPYASYKNSFCGVCNGVPPSFLKCGKLFNSVSLGKDTGKTYSSRTTGTVSLTRLFEFDLDSGFSRVEVKYKCFENVLSSETMCSDLLGEGIISLLYAFNSNSTSSDVLNFKKDDPNKIIPEIQTVFEQVGIGFLRHEIDILELNKTSTMDMQVRFDITVILSAQSKKEFLQSVISVESKTRAVMTNLHQVYNVSRFILSVMFENDQNSFPINIPELPNGCDLDMNEKNSIKNEENVEEKHEQIDGTVMKCYYTKDTSETGVLDVITFVCLLLSILCLFIRVCLQCEVLHFKSGPGRMQFNLTLALLLAFLSWLIGSYLPEYQIMCKTFAVVRYFAFMAAFCWMTNIAVDTWRLFRPNALLLAPDEANTPLLIYHITGWISALILSALVFSVDYTNISIEYRPNLGPPYCWLHGKSIIYFFFIPTGLLILTNLCLFILTSWALKSSFEQSSAVTIMQSKNHFLVYLKLFVLMGITWSLGFLVAITDVPIVEYVFTIVNSLQGVLIFLAFVCTRRTASHFRRRYRSLTSYSNSKNRSTGTTPLSSSK